MKYSTKDFRGKELSAKEKFIEAYLIIFCLLVCFAFFVKIVFL